MIRGIIRSQPDPCRQRPGLNIMMKGPEPILVAHLFRDLHRHLLDLLRSLTAEDWHRPTVCSAWCVKDIASHLLDGDLRR